jgi:hypothetical protein
MLMNIARFCVSCQEGADEQLETGGLLQPLPIPEKQEAWYNRFLYQRNRRVVATASYARETGWLLHALLLLEK